MPIGGGTRSRGESSRADTNPFNASCLTINRQQLIDIMTDLRKIYAHLDGLGFKPADLTSCKTCPK